MRIEDKTGQFSPKELQELIDFIHNDLLSTIQEINWLDVIRIREDARSGYRGYWKFQLRLNAQNQIDGIAAVVVLNYYYVKFLDQTKRLDLFKEILAHEYGHHWTLSYLLAHGHIVDIWTERMPQKYYQIRNLNNQDYACDYSQGWNKCDKEIIAEDYRVLFAPHPYNENHRIVNNPHNSLAIPDQTVKHYIENLKNP